MRCCKSLGFLIVALIFSLFISENLLATGSRASLDKYFSTELSPCGQYLRMTDPDPSDGWSSGPYLRELLIALGVESSPGIIGTASRSIGNVIFSNSKDPAKFSMSFYDQGDSQRKTASNIRVAKQLLDFIWPSIEKELKVSSPDEVVMSIHVSYSVHSQGSPTSYSVSISASPQKPKD